MSAVILRHGTTLADSDTIAWRFVPKTQQLFAELIGASDASSLILNDTLTLPGTYDGPGTPAPARPPP